jgi:hypothetical protein
VRRPGSRATIIVTTSSNLFRACGAYANMSPLLSVLTVAARRRNPAAGGQVKAIEIAETINGFSGYRWSLKRIANQQSQCYILYVI